jgi:lipopolysaccharide export system permease protein
MKLYARLAVGAVLGPLLIGTVTFVVLIVGHLLFQVIRPVVERGVPLSVVLEFILCQVPNAVALALPVSMLLASAIAVHGLARENELLALRAAGLSLPRLLLPVWALGLLVTLAGFLTAEYVQPHADRRAQGIIADVLMSRRTLALQPGKFAGITPEVYVLPGEVDDRTGEVAALKVFHIEPKGTVTFMQTRRARLVGEEFILDRPLICRVDQRGGLTRSAPVAGSRAVVHVPGAIRAYQREQRQLRNMSVKELLTGLRRQREAGPEGARSLRLELHGRLSLAAACLAFALIGGPLALLFRGGHSLGGVLLSIAYAFVYYLGMLWMRILGESGALPPMLAAWLPNTLTLALGGVLVWRRS